MAEANQYFIKPSGEVGIVKPENVEEALRRGLKPATEEQRRQYDAVKAAKAEPLGAVKAFGQALAEGVTALPGIPAALMGVVPSIPEIGEMLPESIRQAAVEQFGEAGAEAEEKRGFALPSAAEVAEAKRLELAGEMARYTTLPGVQQELGLRTAEEIEAEAKAFPVARGAGIIGSFFVGSAAQKVLKGVATRAVPALAAEATLGAEARLGAAVSRATQVEAKQAAATAAQAELNAAVAGGDAVEIASKQTLLNQAQAAAAAASDDAARLNVALAAESGAVPEELASLVTPEVTAASKAARKAAERMSSERATEVLASLTRGQKNLAEGIKKLADVSVSAPAITSKIGTDLAKNVEQRALARLQSAPGFSTRLAEADVALARAADDLAVGEAKAVTGAQLAKAEESLATIKARQEITAKAIGLGLGRSAEMMMFGLQGIANEVALGDPAKVAESAYGVLGFDGTLGVGLGLAEALVPAGLRGGLRVARRTGKRLADALAPVYDDLAAAVTGADVETIRAVRTAGEQLERKTLRQVIEEATPAVPRPELPPEIAPPVVPPSVAKPVMPPVIPKPVMPPPVQRPVLPGMPAPTEVPAFKPVNYEKAAQELRTALQDDVRQIAAPKEGGLLFDANTQWRKVQIRDTIRNRVQQQKDELINALYESKMGEPLTFADEAFLSQIESGEFTNTPYRQSLKDLIGQVRGARNVAKTIGMTGEMVPSAQEAAYKVNAQLAGLEERLAAFEAANPTPEQIYQELKDINQELFFKKKPGAVTGEQLSLLNRQVNAAYSDLKSQFKASILNKDLWGDAAALEAAWREDARAYYAGLKNLKKAAPGLIREVTDPATGLVTEIIIDSKKMKGIVKNINTDAMTDVRNALRQYFDGRRQVIGRIQEVADYVKANVDKQGVAKRMAQTESAYESAIQNAVNDASNAAMEDANLVAAGYSKQQIKDIRARVREEFAAAKEARRAEVEQIRFVTGEAREARKQAVSEIKEEFAAAKEARESNIQESRRVFKEQLDARNRLVEQIETEYKTATAERRAYLEEQARLLTGAAKGGYLKSALKIASKYGGPVIGGLAGGPLGAAAGVIYGAAASPVATSKALAKLNNSLMRASDATSEVSNVLSGKVGGAVKTAEALGSFYSRKEMEKRYKQIEQRTKQLAMDMDAREDQEETMLADLADAAPNVASATRNVNATAIQYLENARPKPPANLPPISLAGWTPIEADQRKFVRIAEAVNNPLETLALASKGALLPEQVAALNTVYPSLMEDVRQKLMERIEETGKIPEKHRMMVSMLLGKDVDGRTQLNRMAPTQSVYGAQAPQQQQLKAYQGKALNVAGRAEYLGKARSEVQPSGVEQRIQARR